MKFLLDECMHTSLVEVAHEFGFVAHHISHMGMAGLKDWQVMDRVIREEFTFVTNNRTDFVALFAKLELHSGLVVIVPNVAPARQRITFRAALAHIGQRDMVNTVVEVEQSGAHVKCSEYALPRRFGNGPPALLR